MNAAEAQTPESIGWLHASLTWDELSNGQVSVVSGNSSADTEAKPASGHCFVATPCAVYQEKGLMILALGTLETDQELATAYRKSPDCFLSKLKGEGLLFLIDSHSGSLLIATDRLGRIPLYYRVRNDGIAVSTSLQWLRNHEELSEINSQGLYNYIYFHMVPAPLTINKGIRKLQAGESIKHTDANTQLSRYWRPVFKETSSRETGEPGQALRKLLKTAVASASSDTGKTGAFLSGGLDSTTVAGMLSEIKGGNCDAYSIGFDAPGYDEMPFARISARHFGLRLHEYYVTPEDVVEELPAIAASFEEPFGNSSALPAFFCAKMAAKDNIDTLLAGDGGDELFAGNARYAQQKVFSHYQRLPGWLRQYMIEPLATLAPKGLPLANKVRSYILQANTPLPDRLQHYSFLHQIAPEDVFTPSLISEIDQKQPLALLREIYFAPVEATDLNRMLFLDWQITLADNDLRKVSQACSLAGIRVKYPMLDDRLLDFSMSIPSEVKLPGRTLRDFYKRSLSGWLPDVTISKSKQGFGLPFGVWMREHKPLQELAYDNILRLDSRNIFRKDFLGDAISRHREGHASYYGELIWVLTVMELWISANLPGYCHE